MHAGEWVAWLHVDGYVSVALAMRSRMYKGSSTRSGKRDTNLFKH